MRSTARVFGGPALRPSRRVCRGLWKRLEEALRRRAASGAADPARRRRGA